MRQSASSWLRLIEGRRGRPPKSTVFVGPKQRAAYQFFFFFFFFLSFCHFLGRSLGIWRFPG